MAAPDGLYELVERFARNRDEYRSGRYNETQVRREFIDPLFGLLGWDIDNKGGSPEAYKDVVHEDAIKVGGAHKAPDYGFRIGGNHKFFVEAKKPSVNLRDAASPSFQLRRYAWSAKLPVSILTDFEELAVYDCRITPDKTDKPTTARLSFRTFDQYPDQWDEIAGVFSKDAVLGGSLDAFAEAARTKRGTATVDAVFLKEIESWREMLARDLALRNPGLTRRELNFAVQMTIDRIIFLRMTEDRGIEEYGRLQALLNGEHVYARLRDLYRQADERYNSGLFHFNKERGRTDQHDDLTPRLAIEDETLKSIIKSLYYPDSPYEFSVLPIEVLGQVYEQFLGKVIDLAPDRGVTIEEKPEVRKAGGVYYTPKYIVDYIVEQTIGKLLEGKKPGARVGASKLRIVDPACGSGSFLIGAYEYLLDWHRDEYINAGPEKHKNVLYQGMGGQWHLTTDEKKRILLNNIYGVDIDPQAVEVTKLSLLLKVLEGESSETLVRQLSMFRERVLPDLSNNIKCGNSLIGPDFYDNRQLSFLDPEEHYRINVFDWRDAFPQVFDTKTSGFSAVIGNPPWISLTGKFGNSIYSPDEVSYLVDRYKGNTYMPNMYEYFVAKGLDIVGDDGYFSFVVPDRLGFNRQFVDLRDRIVSEAKVVSLVYKSPFPGVTVDTLIFVFQKAQASANHQVVISEYGNTPIQRRQAELSEHPTRAFEFFENSGIMQLIAKMDVAANVVLISEICDSTSGFGGKSKLIQDTKSSANQIATYKGDSIGRYQNRKIYWFDFRRENITGRTTDRSKLGALPKILLRKTGDSIVATFDDSGIFPEQSLYFLYNNKTELSFQYLLGVLNSRLLTFYYRARSLTNRRSIAQVKKVDLDALPIPRLDLNVATDKILHDTVVKRVEQMLALHQQRVDAKTSHDRTIFQRQIDATDRQIDRLVYELYGLTEDEIAVVEAAQ